MNELMTREEFLSERNAIYEKTDEPSKGPRIVIPGAGKDEQLTADGITVSEIVIKNRQSRQYAGLILFITAVAGAVAGAVLYGDMTVVISDEMLKNYLSGRIHGGFFGNAAASFIGTFVCCYQCQLSLSCSNNILATLRGRRETAPHYYKIYIERFAVCCIGCFLLGIADAGISFLLGPIFVI